MRNDRDSKYLRRILALAALALLLVLALIYGTKGALAMFPWFNDANVEAVLDERFDIQGVRRINLDVGSLTVEVCSTPQEQVRLVFQTNLPPDKRAELAVERDGDTFVVEQLPRARFGKRKTENFQRGGSRDPQSLETVRQTRNNQLRETQEA